MGSHFREDNSWHARLFSPETIAPPTRYFTVTVIFFDTTGGSNG